MPRTKKSSKRTSKQNEMFNLEMPSEMDGESTSQRGEYGRRSTRPRTAGRSSSVSRTSIKGPRGTRAKKSSASRTSGRGGSAKKSTRGGGGGTSQRGRSTKRGSRGSR